MEVCWLTYFFRIMPRNRVHYRYGGELLPKLVPSLSALSTNLENLEWLVSLNSSVGDLVNYIVFHAFYVLTCIQ